MFNINSIACGKTILFQTTDTIRIKDVHEAEIASTALSFDGNNEAYVTVNDTGHNIVIRTPVRNLIDDKDQAELRKAFNEACKSRVDALEKLLPETASAISRLTCLNPENAELVRATRDLMDKLRKAVDQLPAE